MKISCLKEAVMLCYRARITPFIWGHRGVGKSSIVRQVCEEHRMGCIDFRLSQMEASDLRGMPSKENGRTHFMPPADMPIGDMTWTDYQAELKKASPEQVEKLKVLLQPRLQNGIIFLDEQNRAQDDVLQCSFQLVLDRRTGETVLPSGDGEKNFGWGVCSAGNFQEGYLVNGFNDPAFLSRFCHLTFSAGDTTMPEWVDHIGTRWGADASHIIEFAVQDMKFLDGEITGDLGFSTQPNRRAWESVIRVEKCYHTGYDFTNENNEVTHRTFSKEARMAVLTGLLGHACAAAYDNYVCPIKPQDLIDKGVEHYSAELKKMGRKEHIGFMWGLNSYIKPHIEEDKYAKCALSYVKYMCQNGQDKDLVVAFCNTLIKINDKRIHAAIISNPEVARMFGQGAAKKSFLARLCADPALQELLSCTSWGKDPNAAVNTPDNEEMV